MDISPQSFLITFSYSLSYYTCPQCFLIRWLNNFGDFNLILIGWIIELNVQTFQPLFLIYRRGNFVYHHSWCTSCPFRSLKFLCQQYLATHVSGKLCMKFKISSMPCPWDLFSNYHPFILNFKKSKTLKLRLICAICRENVHLLK